MTTALSEEIAALVADLCGPDGTDGAALAERLERMPVALGLSVALYLARCGDAAAHAVARDIFTALRPLAGETVRMDDDLARLALALGQPRDAVALLEARLARSEALTASQWLARAYLAAGRVAEAETVAARLRREVADRVTTWLVCGEVALASGDLATAAEAYLRALALAPIGTWAMLGLARCHAALGEGDAARDSVVRVFAAYQDAPSAFVLREAITIAEELGDADWTASLRARLDEQDAREAASLRTMLAAALDPARAGDTGAGASQPRGPRGRDGARIASARTRLARMRPPETQDAEDEDAASAPALDVEEEEPAAPELLDALRDHFGYESFLPGQATIIQAVMRGEDVLALMPTGAGKSLCYQLPALLLPGTTVLISPLIALMKDQVEGLPAAVRARATVINSLVDRDALDQRLLDIAAGRYKLVYAAPERLRQQSFVYALARAGVARFVVDEAHCVSMWGHDFRPDYLFIARALAQLGGAGATAPPVLALTATATPDVRESIAEALRRDLRVINRGVFRPNLAYEVVPVTNNEERQGVLERIIQETPGPGIVYVRSRQGCEQVAEFLARRRGISARYYHAGMERAEREAAQDDFIAGRARVVVATVAFGMGIDKPDVRFIIHYQLPGSLEAYVQESGRAGRDGKPSRCVLFVSTADTAQVRRHVSQDELSIETLRAVYATTRGLVRGGAPPGAPAGRVAAADLEREVSAAIEASGRQVDDTAARVALSLLERAGFLRRHPDVPRAPGVRMGVDLPHDPTEAAAFHAFTNAAHLRPRQFQTLDLVSLAAELRLAPAALEDRLLGWRDVGLIEYRDGARDLLVEITPPPADGKTALPELLAFLAERHDRQVDALVAYTTAATCRQRVIARHFGERLPVAACGVCDHCRGVVATVAPSGRRLRGRAPRPDAETVRATILACLRDLPYQVGVSGLVRILTGSIDTTASAMRSPHFGALTALGPTRLTREVQAMVAEGLLLRDDDARYPTLRLPGA